MSDTQSSQAHPNMDTMFGVLRRVFLENGRKYTRDYTIAIVCLAIAASTTAFTAWIMESVVNEAFKGNDAQRIWLICGAIFLSFMLRGVVSYWQAVILAKIGNDIIATYQRRVFDHLMKLSVSFYGASRSATLAAQINQNVSGIRVVLNLTVTSIARDLLTFLALIGVMFSKDWKLSLIIILTAPPLLLGLRYVSKRLKSATRSSVEINSHVLGAIQETIQGVSIVKAFTMEEPLKEKVGKLIENAEARANRIVRLSERTAPMTESFAGLSISCIIAYAGYQSVYGGVEPGAFFAFVTALLMAYDPAKRLARLQVQMEGAATNARMLYEILDIVPNEGDRPDAKPLSVTQAALEFRNVAFAYKGTKSTLNGVSFLAEGGKTTALVGPSGAGKSTVISLIPRFYDPEGGDILIDGQDITHITKASLRQHIAYVSQQPYLFEGTIRDNIRYGRPDATDAEVEEAAKMAYAHDFILAQPEGYETPVGENGMTLSGGQRQRLSIARALVRNAPILLLDEATSALDTESEAFVQKALDTAMQGRTVIVIAHRLSTIINADKIVVMEEGKVVEQGTHAALLAKEDGIYARLASIQSARATAGQEVE